MKKQINITMDSEIYESIVKAAGIRQSETGKLCSISKLAGEIFIPAAKQYFNGNEDVSPLTIETKTEVSNPFEGCLNILNEKENDNEGNI